MLYKHSLFIGFNDHEGSKVVEVAFDLEKSQYNLVRYFKTSGFISSFYVFDMMSSFEGMNPYLGSSYSMEAYLFLVENYDTIEIYPFDLDPRTINSVYNAVRLKYKGVRHIYPGRADHLLIISDQGVTYNQLAIDRPSIACRSKRNSASASSYRVVLTANESSCAYKRDQIGEKTFFNEYCESESHYWVRLSDPESS